MQFTELTPKDLVPLFSRVPTCRHLQSTVPKKMVAGHFPTILCKPSTASKHRENHLLLVMFIHVQ